MKKKKGKKKKKKNRNRSLTRIIVTLACIIVLTGGMVGYILFSPQFFPEQPVRIFLDNDDSTDSIYSKVKTTGHSVLPQGYRLMQRLRPQKFIHTGSYLIYPNDNAYKLYQRIYRGQQEPVNVTIGHVRTIAQLVRNIGQQLMIDSTEIATRLNDTAYIARMGYTSQTLPCLFIPDTYEVYWNISAETFIKRMKKEHNRFWNDTRCKKAKAIGLSPDEVCTLASIVDEETNKTDEKPIVAGLYLNRLRIGMPLQADPTVKFALQDFSLKRILNIHLTTDSPYNTYRHIGLPPGPIRIASKEGIEAVLNHSRHNYLYMCAKEDFSGYHNFASNLNEHNRNARKYQQALNKKGIYK